MLKKGFVSCLGTDTHNLTDRAPDFARAKQGIEEMGYGEKLEEIFATMQKILDNESVNASAYKPVKRIFNKYF